MHISLHNVSKIELVKSFPGNGNSRTIRITYQQAGDDAETTLEMVCFGETSALDALPRASDFKMVDRPVSYFEATEAA